MKGHARNALTTDTPRLRAGASIADKTGTFDEDFTTDQIEDCQVPAKKQFHQSSLGEFVGRFRTCDAAPFIVDADAALLKRNPRLSRHARNLYGTMRALADGKTGELRINGRWLRATVLDKAAEMCKRVRMAAMRELVAAGYVLMQRPLVHRELGGRARAVLGPSQYTVLKIPQTKIDKKL